MKRVVLIGALMIGAVQGGVVAQSSGAGTTMQQPATNTMTIAAIVAGDPRFSTLLAALKAADLTDTLAGKGPFTVFAPTNEAFAKIPQDQLQALLANKEQLTRVLTYHVVSGAVNAEQVSKLTSAATVAGPEVKVAVMDGKVMINDATVTQADVMASNGVVHVIDSVLMPPAK